MAGRRKPRTFSEALNWFADLGGRFRRVYREVRCKSCGHMEVRPFAKLLGWVVEYYSPDGDWMPMGEPKPSPLEALEDAAQSCLGSVMTWKNAQDENAGRESNRRRWQRWQRQQCLAKKKQSVK